jgi:hypothetical protein
MSFTFDASTVLGALGVGLSLASFIMKRMLALRFLAIGANVAFIGFAIALFLKPDMDPAVPLPGLLLNLVLLPINLRRVWEIRRLTSGISKAGNDSPPSVWLLPHMRHRTLSRGTTVFKKGDPADRLLYLARGELKLLEIGQSVGPGELLGEIGLFAPERRRTQTAECETDVDIYEMTDEMLFQLYYQHPKIGFYIVRLIAARLLRDVERQKLAAQAA